MITEFQESLSATETLIMKYKNKLKKCNADILELNAKKSEFETTIYDLEDLRDKQKEFNRVHNCEAAKSNP